MHLPPKDSIANTFMVTLILCVVCSLLVSASAVSLKGMQERNKLLDRQKNIISAAGLAEDPDNLSGDEIEEIFKSRVTAQLVDLATGEYVANPATSFDPRKAAKDAELSVAVEGPFSNGQARREKATWVYLVQDANGQIEQVVVPVYGMGLWSTLYGYVAVDKDLRTIKGLTYYEHGETPGLGGEVENPAWKEKWIGKKIYEEGVPLADIEDDDVRVGVAKGRPTPENEPYQVDGLSGATITSRGVDSMLKYWFSDEGFGPYFKKLASQQLAFRKGADHGNTHG